MFWRKIGAINRRENFSGFAHSVKSPVPAVSHAPPPTQPTTTKEFNAVINRLASQGAHHDVLITFSSMLKCNASPDAFSFPSLLKACTSLELISHGVSLHQCIVVNGYSSDAYIASSLINFYAKFGCINNARQVFDMMRERNVVPWTTIIGCYSRVGDFNTAICMYSEMQNQGIRPCCVTLLGMLSGVSELTYVQCLHACAIRYGFDGETPLVNSILNLYGRCGRVEDARELFESIVRRDIISWNSLVSAYSQTGDVEEILQLLDRMRHEGMVPDKQTYGSLVSATATQSRPELAKQVLGQILRAELKLDKHIGTSLVTMYLKCRSVNDAFKIFELIPEKDVIMWTAMISGLAQNDCADKALTFFHWMLKSGTIPSTAAIASALAACAQLGSFDLGTSIHGYMVRQRMRLDIPAENSLVTMYAKCGHLEQSCAVFDRMSKKDLVSWNAIVAGYAQNGLLCEALSIFNEMRTTLQKPDSITVVSLLQACASIGALHQGKWIHNFVIRNSLGPSFLVDTALVDMYSKCGDLDKAQKCFDGMSEHDLVSWTAIIAGYGSHGKGEIALRMYSEFLQTGIKPNHVIFLSIISACSHNGLVQQGLTLFHNMTNNFGIEPKLEHQACIVDLLCRAGRIEEAYNFYRTTFPEPTPDVLGILLDACRTKGSVELGNIIAKEILMLKPESAENYVQIANSYAAMNQWDGVGETWSKMRSLGLKKFPGWSSIEVHGTCTTFFMYHSTTHQFQEIMLLLKVLSWEMKKSNIM